MADLERFVPGARLRMRPFQHYIKRVWRREWHGLDILIPFPEKLKGGLVWWLDEARIKKGVSLEQKTPELQLFSDASRKGWGATLGSHQVSGTWKQSELKDHINVLELRAIFYALQELENLVSNKSIAVFADNSGIYQKTGGDEVLEAFQARRAIDPMDRREKDSSNPQIYRRKKEQGSRYSEQGRRDSKHRVDVKPASLSSPVETLGPSTSRRLCDLPHKEAASLLLASPRPSSSRSGCSPTKLGPSRPLCFSPICDNPKGHKQDQEVTELSSDDDNPMVASKRVVSGPDGPGCGGSQNPPLKERPSPSTKVKSSTSGSVRSSDDRMEVIIKLTRKKGLSEKVSNRIIKARASTTNTLYQLRWKQFANWCKEHRYSAVRPSTDTLCKFFIYLWEVKKLAVSTIKGFRSVLHSVLRHNGINVSEDPDISDVIRSFIIERPVKKRGSVAWNIDVVLRYLCSKKFEPLEEIPLKELTKKTLFLVAMALAKRVSELQALSKDVGFTSEGALVSLLLGFRAKNDNKVKGLPRDFLVKGLTHLVGQEEERKLCPVRALRAYLERTRNLRDEEVRNLFLAPRNPSRAASKNALAYFLKSTILEAYKNMSEDTARLYRVTPHEIRAVSASLSFAHNLSIDAVLEAAQWRSNTVFTSHYLKDVSIEYQNCRSLGPIVAAGTIIM